MAIFKKSNFKQGYIFYFVLIIINFPKINLISNKGSSIQNNLIIRLILRVCLICHFIKSI